jgi:excisionase family DNA binding protein
MQTLEQPRCLATVKEAASYLRVSVAKVYLMMGAGELATVKLGKCRRIPWQALEQLVQRCLAGERQQPQPAA